jgi:hypothetical protein
MNVGNYKGSSLCFQSRVFSHERLTADGALPFRVELPQIPSGAVVPDLLIDVAAQILSLPEPSRFSFLAAVLEVEPDLDLDFFLFSLLRQGHALCDICALLINFDYETVVSMTETMQFVLSSVEREPLTVVKFVRILLGHPGPCSEFVRLILDLLERDLPDDVIECALYGLLNASSANFGEFWPVFRATDSLALLLLRFAHHPAVVTRIIQAITAKSGDPTILSERGLQCVIVVSCLSADATQRVSGLRALSTLCQAAPGVRLCEDSLLRFTIGRIGDCGWEERLVVLEILDVLFSDAPEELVQWMSPEFINVIFDMLEARDDKSATLILRMLIAVMDFLAPQPAEEFQELLREEGIDALLSGLVEDCSGHVYRLVIELSSLIPLRLTSNSD